MDVDSLDLLTLVQYRPFKKCFYLSAFNIANFQLMYVISLGHIQRIDFVSSHALFLPNVISPSQLQCDRVYRYDQNEVLNKSIGIKTA